MPGSDDYYALLGIDASADDEELRRAWRRLALRFHPDVAGEATTARFQQIAARTPCSGPARARGMMRPVSFCVRL